MWPYSSMQNPLKSYCPDEQMSKGKWLVLSGAHRVCLAPKPCLLPLCWESLRRDGQEIGTKALGTEIRPEHQWGRDLTCTLHPPYPPAEGGL